jgi:hypothetical protein
MAIVSHAFGSVTLTDKDAEKFERQVRYGKPKAAAIEGVKRGVDLSRKFNTNGKLTFTLKASSGR